MAGTKESKEQTAEVLLKLIRDVSKSPSMNSEGVEQLAHAFQMVTYVSNGGGSKFI